MTKIKSLFSTTKRKVISIICIVIIVLLLAFAIGAIVVRATSIGEDEAQRIALEDAALDESEVSGLRARLGYDDGRFCYDVDFYSNGVEYEYSIQASDGDIVSRDIDGNVPGMTINQNLSSQADSPATESSAESQQLIDDSSSQSEQVQAQTPAQPQNDSSQADTQQTDSSQADAQQTDSSRTDSQQANTQQSNSQQTNTQQSGIISEEQAKAAALADAGLSESQVTFIRVNLDRDDRTTVYDVEFYTSDTEYDYEINASDGTVREKSTEAFNIQSNGGNTGGNDSYIGVDRAKQIALDHAGFTESQVQFSKAKLENDDGMVEYDVSFYYNGMEYEYTINAVSGDIMEYDHDRG